MRLLSLYHGIQGQTTAERIDRLQQGGYLDDADRLRAAWSLIIYLLLRQQVSDHRRGAPVGNYLPPNVLSHAERVQLVEAYRSIRQFCQHTAKTVRRAIPE